MNLRRMMDGAGRASLGLFDFNSEHQFKPQQDVVIRRRTSRSGPATNEVIVGKILAVGDTTATVSVAKQGGITERRTVNLSDLSPVTASFKRSSIQFSPQYRPRA